MPTIRLDLAYDGTGFRGWAAQRDPAIRTVQGVVTARLATVLGHTPRLIVAGRTDAGVHARGQVASFVTETTVAPANLASALNGTLAPEVVVRYARVVSDGFDARRAASAREYAYRIDTASLPDPFTARYVWHRPGTLSAPAMRAAAAHLVGEHDFASFGRRPGEDRSTVRHVDRVAVRRVGDTVEVRIRANAFLQQMVRAIVGTLVAVGDGRVEASDVPSILAARDRSAAAAPVAPPQGLTLERVVYGRRRHP